MSVLEPDTLRPSEEKIDPAERVEKAKKLKEEGNAKFKTEDLPGARKAYAEALRLTQKLPEDLALEAAVSLRRPVQLNLALVCLRLDPSQPMRALELCEEVLDAEPENPKATYRKAKALLELGEEKEAEFEFVRACKLMPKDATVRKDLEALRKAMRKDKAKEQETFQGLFQKSPGFASEGRQTQQRLTKQDVDDIYFHDGKENPYEGAERPQDLASGFQKEGRLEDAAQAWEVAMGRSAQEEDWLSHFQYALEYGVLLMDLNIDRLALRCFNTVFERPVEESLEESAKPLRQHALLLKSICLLNESADAQAEITECLQHWLQMAHKGEHQLSPEERLLQLREQGTWTADTAVALGLLQLLTGQDSVPETFASAVVAEDSSFFGAEARRSTRWNMLGAVLNNRGFHEQAIEVWRHALQCQPQYPRALVNMAMAQLKCGSFLAACASQAQALKASPVWATEEIWVQLEKEAMAQTNIDDLAEAVRARRIEKVQELLEPHAEHLDTTNLEPPLEVLKKMKLLK